MVYGFSYQIYFLYILYTLKFNKKNILLIPVQNAHIYNDLYQWWDLISLLL